VLEVILEPRSFTLNVSVEKTRNLSILISTANLSGDPKEFFVFFKGKRYENIEQHTFNSINA